MVTSATRERDAVVTPTHLATEFEGIMPAAGAHRLADEDCKQYRQAAQYRNGRLRTIEALRRPRK